MTDLKELARKVWEARQTGLDTGKADDRLKGGRAWTEFTQAATAKGMSADAAERFLRQHKPSSHCLSAR